GKRGFLEKYPPVVPDNEKNIILGTSSTDRAAQLSRDIAAVVRLLETALVLNFEGGCSERDLEKLHAKNEKLAAEVLKLENELIDHRGKHANYVAQAKELREMQV
ncbi:hypothetical protein A2U01_0069182, partial [Trifolium medium]|nr:hypothetical protein [Trifolium medium]